MTSISSYSGSQYRFVGDIHGKVFSYSNILRGFVKQQGEPTPFDGVTVQVGDFGWGWKNDTVYDARAAKLIADCPSNFFIRGNHDDPAVCRQQPNFIEDGTFHNRVKYIGGAYSINQHELIPGVTWWEDEELSYEQLEQQIDLVEQQKPRVMVTHDCPTSVAHTVFQQPRISAGGNPLIVHSRTARALDEMLDIHQPEIWIFGHWHLPVDVTIDGTRFICLGELCLIDFDLENITGTERMFHYNPRNVTSTFEQPTYWIRR